MYHLTADKKAILAENIRYYKDLHFPGKGSGIRLAAEIGVPPQTLSNWLNGSRQPTAIQLYRLAVAFKVSPLELCGFQKAEALPQNTPEMSILHDVVTLMNNAEKDNVDPRVTAKTLHKFKTLLEQGLEEMFKNKNQ